MGQRVSIYIDDDLHQQVSDRASAEERSWSSTASRLIREGLSHTEGVAVTAHRKRWPKLWERYEAILSGEIVADPKGERISLQVVFESGNGDHVTNDATLYGWDLSS